MLKNSEYREDLVKILNENSSVENSTVETGIWEHPNGKHGSVYRIEAEKGDQRFGPVVYPADLIEKYEEVIFFKTVGAYLDKELENNGWQRGKRNV